MVDLVDNFERFDGREHSVFTEMAKERIKDLIYSLATVEEELVKGSATTQSLENYIQLIYTFKTCYLLVSEKLQSDSLKSEIESLLISPVEKNSERRKDVIKST
ncbi:MAG: hypothetical protein Q4P17_07600, partial [Methanobacterium sp.]|nr:hypothetical protein [Methanobacterium sp.]